MWYGAYWDEADFRTMEVIDNGLVWPVGFVWFEKPRYRVKCKGVYYGKRK